MSKLKLYYKAFKIYIVANYLAIRYKQNTDNIYKAYMNLYCDFKSVESLLKYCKMHNIDFDTGFNSLIKAKSVIEKVFMKKGDSDKTDSSDIDDKKL